MMPFRNPLYILFLGSVKLIARMKIYGTQGEFCETAIYYEVENQYIAIRKSYNLKLG
jgi:hypothetical protein